MAFLPSGAQEICGKFLKVYFFNKSEINVALQHIFPYSDICLLHFLLQGLDLARSGGLFFACDSAHWSNDARI